MASTTYATSTPYKRGFDYDALGNLTEQGTTTGAVSVISSPSHLWKFDESSGVAYDAVGSNHLTNNNSTPYGAGKINNAADFERSNSNYFSISDGAQLGLDGLTDLSLAMWVNLESQPGTSDCHRFVEKNEPTDRSYVFEYCDVSGSKRLYFVASSDGSAMTTKYVTWSPSLSAWYFIAATMDGGGDLKFYVDGVQQGSTQTGMPSGIYNGGSAFYVGRYDGGAYYMDGKIDEVGFWPSVLSAAEISALYNSGAGLPYPYSVPPSGNSVYEYAGTDYANPHAVTSIRNGTATTTYSYDNNGNLTAAGIRAFTWDYANRLTQVAGTGTSTYGYDHAGQRVLQAAGGATTTYPTKLYSIVGATTTEYIYAGNDLVATVEGDGSATTTRYVHADHLGSTNVVSDGDMDAVQVLDYYPYGSTRIDTGADVSQRQFIGQFSDEETNLSYLNARYYEGSRGQFLSQDATHLAIGHAQQIKQLTGMDQQRYLTDPQSLNSYAYARGNPIVNKDPQGNFAVAVPYAIVTAPQWGPAVAGGIIAAGTYIASDIVLRNNERMRYVPFDAKRLPPSWMLGPQNPMETKPPNFDGVPKWIVGAIAGAWFADAVREFVEPIVNQESFLKRLKELQQDAIRGSVSNPSLGPTNTPYSTAGASQSGGGRVSLSSLRAQLESALSTLKALSDKRDNKK